eukprot:s151_g51.t1
MLLQILKFEKDADNFKIFGSMSRESRLWTKVLEVDTERNIKISLIEDPTTDAPGDAWCAWCIWPAAKVLMTYLSTMEDSFLKQSSVLELGSGCGAVGMYAAMRGAHPVVLSDVSEALPLLKRNVVANHLGSRCTTCAVPWGTSVERLAAEVQCHRPFDLVLAADCSYDFLTPELPCSIDALLATARACGKRALICVSRRKNEVEAFIAAATRAGLDPQIVYTAEVDENKEGVAECLIFSFDFVQQSAIIQKVSIYGSMQLFCAAKFG